MVRPAAADLARSPWPHQSLAGPRTTNTATLDAGCSRCGASGSRSHQQPSAQPAQSLPALPPVARPSAPLGAAPDHVPSAPSVRRPVPRALSRSMTARCGPPVGFRVNVPGSTFIAMNGPQLTRTSIAASARITSLATKFENTAGNRKLCLS